MKQSVQDSIKREDSGETLVYFSHPLLLRNVQPDWHKELKNAIEKSPFKITMVDSSDLRRTENDHVSPQRIMEDDLKILRSCQIVIVDMTGKDGCLGTICEMYDSFLEQKIIISVIDTFLLSPWLIALSTAIVDVNIPKIMSIVNSFSARRFYNHYS